MKIPKYIIEKIERNNNLTKQANKLSEEISSWYENAANKICNLEDCDIPIDEFGEISFEYYFSTEMISYNLSLLENYMKNRQ